MKDTGMNPESVAYLPSMLACLFQHTASQQTHAADAATLIPSRAGFGSPASPGAGWPRFTRSAPAAGRWALHSEQNELSHTIGVRIMHRAIDTKEDH